MEQQRIKKVKLFRTLKVIYYCLGMPLLLLAVMTLASQLYGRYPFAGNGNDAALSQMIKVFFNSPAMYGVWIALAIWVVIGLVQIICSMAIKNRRSRAMVVIAVMLVVLLVPVFVIDAIYTSKVDEIAIEAGKLDGTVTVKDYKDQLSYYRYNTGGEEGNGLRTSYTDELIDDVEDFLRVYNIPYYGDMKLSEAANFANQALYYDDPIFTVAGFDYNANGVVGDEGDHVRVDVTFNPDNYKPVENRYWFKEITVKDINGENEQTITANVYARVYEQIMPTEYGNIDKVVAYKNFVWYNGDKFVNVDENNQATKTEGHYGLAYYNQNGLLADGYIYDIDVALNILEAYYQAQLDMETAYAAYKAAGGELEEDDLKEEILKNANAKLESYYVDNDDAYIRALYESEMAAAAGYSLTAGELNTILSALGENVGGLEAIGSLLGGISSFKTLSFSLSDILGLVLDESLVPVINSLLSDDIKSLNLAIGTTDGFLTVTASLASKSDAYALVLDDEFGLASVKGLLDYIGINNDALASLITMLGLSATAEDNSQEAFDAMIVGILETLYSFESPVILPAYDFYADELAENASELEIAENAYAQAYSEFMRATHEGGTHGYMAGCRLIGSDLGDGSYDSSHGLADLSAVQQLKTDISYKPAMYSILIVRDMLMTFAVFALFFTAMYYIAADREVLWATGQVEVKSKKAKKSKKGADAVEDEASIDVENIEEV